MSELKNLKVYINALRQCAKEHENDTADLLEKNK